MKLQPLWYPRRTQRQILSAPIRSLYPALSIIRIAVFRPVQYE